MRLIALLLCVLLPLLVVGMGLLAFTFNWRLGRLFFGVTLGIWAVAMIFCGVVAIGNARFFNDVLPDHIEHWDERTHGDWDDRYDGRGRIRDSHRSIENIDAVGADSRDSLVTVDENGEGDAAEVSSESWVSSSESDAADEATDDIGGRRRIEIKRIEK